MPATIDDAICLRCWEYSETSQTVELLSRTMGLVRGLAKGSRRPKAPYDGGIEMLTRGQVGVIIRPSSELALITEWSLTQVYPALRSDLHVHRAGLYLADLMHHVIVDHDPHPAIFDACVEFLAMIRAAQDVAPALLKLHWTTLVHTGHKPELAIDIRADAPLEERETYAFHPALGGFSDSAGSPIKPTDGESWQVRRATLRTLRAIDQDGLQSLSTSTPADVDRANRLLAAYVRYLLGVEPVMMRELFKALPSG